MRNPSSLMAALIVGVALVVSPSTGQHEGHEVRQAPLEFFGCADLIPEVMQVQWLVEDGARVRYRVRAAMSAMDYAAFGVAAADATDVRMIGSDVTVVGVMKGKAFATDYMISSKSQCDYTSTRVEGVCPDKQQDAELVLGSVVNGVGLFEYTRPLVSTDAKDVPIKAKGAQFIAYAVGPLQESTSGEPLVLYHRVFPQLSSAATVRSVDLSVASKCTSVVKPAAGTSNSTSVPVHRPKPGATIVVTLENVVNYPNPPGWGVAYHLDGEETPILELARGSTYTFEVKAGATHPFYITESEKGGNDLGEKEKIYAGGADSHGTSAQPYLLTWKVPSDTPDLVWYGCFEHQKLGYKVQITGEKGVAKAGVTSASSYLAPASNAILFMLSSLFIFVQLMAM